MVNKLGYGIKYWFLWRI